MNALLINPHKLLPESVSITPKASPPLGLAYIASALKNVGYSVQVIDCIAEDPENYFPFEDFKGMMVQGIHFHELDKLLLTSYDIIGFSCMFSSNWLIHRKLINHLRQYFPKALIVAGGEHVSAIPEYCLSDCLAIDMIVTGEGEETITEIAHALSNGLPFSSVTGTVLRAVNSSSSYINNGRRNRIKSIDEIANPDWSAFPVQKYFEHELSYGVALGNSLPISATRGCPYQCTFCSSPQMWTTRYVMRDVESVIQEIKILIRNYQVTNIDFFDLTAIIKKQWIMDFCRAVMRENLNITWQIPAGTRSEVIDYELAAALKEAGCANITYAPESGSERILGLMKKKVKLERMLKSIGDSHKVGLNIKLNIIMGYPDEQLKDIIGTFAFLIKASFYGAHDASPSIFNPYPGSAQFSQLLKEGKVSLNDDYFSKTVFADTFHGFISYNPKMSKPYLIFFQYMGYFVFYFSNFLFRPFRAFTFIWNIYRKKYASRGEYMIGEVFRRFSKIQEKKLKRTETNKSYESITHQSA